MNRTMTDDDEKNPKLPALRPPRSLLLRQEIGQGSRRIRKVSPLGFRVVVRLEKEPNMTDTGLYLPEGSKQAMMESLLAEVVEVASASEAGSDEEMNVSGIPLGAKVLIPKSAGVKIPWDADCRIVETQEILAIVHEIALT